MQGWHFGGVPRCTWRLEEDCKPQPCSTHIEAQDCRSRHAQKASNLVRCPCFRSIDLDVIPHEQKGVQDAPSHQPFSCASSNVLATQPNSVHISTSIRGETLILNLNMHPMCEQLPNPPPHIPTLPLRPNHHRSPRLRLRLPP